MTTINLQEKLSAYCADRFSDYYPMPDWKAAFPSLTPSADLIGVIVPEEFRTFGELPDAYPVRIENTSTIFDDGLYNDITDVILVRSL